MKKFLLFAALAFFAVVYSCQKDSLTDAVASGTSIAGERGGHGHHFGDTLHHVCDSLHLDSLGHPHHPHDSLDHPIDSMHIHHWPDSTWTGGGHPDPDSTGGPHNGPGGHHGHHGGH